MTVRVSHDLRITEGRSSELVNEVQALIEENS